MPQQHQLSPSGLGETPNLADVMQFVDFCPKLALNQTRNQDDQEGGDCEGNIVNVVLEEKENQDDENDYNSMQLHRENKNDMTKEVKSKRKRARTSNTSEEVESQLMTHIAVERNRRSKNKQMNEHLRILRSLMPGSYVQRRAGSTSIESQKRRSILGETGNRQIGELTTTMTSSSPITSVANPLIITGNVRTAPGRNSRAWLMWRWSCWVRSWPANLANSSVSHVFLIDVSKKTQQLWTKIHASSSLYHHMYALIV
ncbi:hypothetical protein Bca4012_083519 [Brassica carinata]|uniref:BHLH domain-containing protein n=1 Tax=Brassica carinata TaxID=52824 RepID=A0A8X7SLJ1_BRACI|nr:hypothetical protein Bca52824_027212 [Brassica carinata]